MKMLINNDSAGARIAIVDDNQRLVDYDFESIDTTKPTKDNILKGIVRNIEPSLNAAFIQFGPERQGFLSVKEVSPTIYAAKPSDPSKPSIDEVLKVGQEIVVQVDKEERGNKGAALTTYISLAGRYLVLMPNNPRAGGISRRIEGEKRDDLRDILDQLDLPEGMGIIIRTAGVEKSLADLQWDLDNLLKLWKSIEDASNIQPAPYLIHEGNDLVFNVLRDKLQPEIDEILIDDDELTKRVKEVIQPAFVKRVKYYHRTTPLFTHYHLESQIESIHHREVRLPSGGVIVFDPTEALVSIDVNSARATKGQDIESTALSTNLEAVREIARQLRMRDLGGIIVIDLIDMMSTRNQRLVETELREALKDDRARKQIGKISRFGLLEMSRQRLKHSLVEMTQSVCPRCNGQGTIRNTRSLALSIIRLIESEANKHSQGRHKPFQLNVQVPVDVASFLINEKRQLILDIEKNHHTSVFVIANKDMQTPHFKIERIDADSASAKIISYERVEHVEKITLSTDKLTDNITTPASVVLAQANEKQVNTPAPGLLKRIISGLFGPDEENSESNNTVEAKASPTPRHKKSNQQHREQKNNRRSKSSRKPSSENSTKKPRRTLKQKENTKESTSDYATTSQDNSAQPPSKPSKKPQQLPQPSQPTDSAAPASGTTTIEPLHTESTEIVRQDTHINKKPSQLPQPINLPIADDNTTTMDEEERTNRTRRGPGRRLRRPNSKKQPALSAFSEESKEDENS